MQNRTIRLNKRTIVTVCIGVLVVIGIVVGIAAYSANHTGSNSDKPSNQSSTTSVSTTQQTTQKPSETTAPSTESVNRDEWNLILVNPNNKMPDGYQDDIELTQLKNGQAVDSRCYPDLQEMMDDCRKAGLSPVICSSYRSQETQEYLYNRKVNQFRDKGYSTEEAKIEAGKIVAVPGTSEHQLGLAVDIVDESYQTLDEEQENTAAQKWLIENSYKYGWILRYPSSKSSLTGIIYEPWHYRYVGKEAAKEIYEAGICLEEYLK